MTNAVSDAKAIKKLRRELDRAERFAREALDEQAEIIPPSLLVIFKQPHKYPPMAFPLFTLDNLELSIIADLRSNLRDAAIQVTNYAESIPVYALSMIEIIGEEQDFWQREGFFAASELSESFIGQDTLLITASDSSGRVLRRLIRLVDSPLLLNSSSRQLGRSIQIAQREQPTEMAAFWQQYKDNF